MRPILRPGTHVLHRADGQLQVGLDPDSALILPDTQAVRDSLAALASPGGPAVRLDASIVRLLDGHDLVTDERDLIPVLSAGGSSPPATAALARSAGPAVGRLLAARRRWRVATRTFGHPAGTGLAAQLVAHLEAAGLREVATRGTAPPDCVVLLGVGEPDRDLVDPCIRDGTPHLLVRLTEGRAVVGPFVVPGTTACLRCVDAHCTDADPAWPLLVRQYASLCTHDRPDGTPEPVDPLLAAVALAWAARDLVSYVDGVRPSCWSATVTIHPRLSRLETRGWLRHPLCGCTWEPLDRSNPAAAPVAGPRGDDA